MLTWLVLAAATGTEPIDIRHEGAFGFPQDRAVVLCDDDSLRVSVANDSEHLYIQAVLWGDDDPALGLTPDGREIGDHSSLVLDLDSDRERTANLDRTYALNPWPSRPGLNYSVSVGRNASTGLQGDSKGRGSINYVETTDGETVRVECFLIPLEEIGIEAGASIRLGYWGASTSPALTVNSVGFVRDGSYYPHHLPATDFHEITLGDDEPPLDMQAVPEGRDSIVVADAPPREAPEIGSRPPEVSAAEWMNWEGEAPTLQSLRGKVVVVEFWATWCGPCVAGIPHLNELHERYADEGLVLLSLTDQAAVGIEKFREQVEMRYPLGVGSRTSAEYGVTGIPRAFVISRDGLLRWEGHPAADAFEAAIKAALAETPTIDG